MLQGEASIFGASPSLFYGPQSYEPELSMLHERSLFQPRSSTAKDNEPFSEFSLCKAKNHCCKI